MDLPIFTFIGAWWLLLSFDVAGASGLIFPGIFGWMFPAVRRHPRAGHLASRAPILPAIFEQARLCHGMANVRRCVFADRIERAFHHPLDARILERGGCKNSPCEKGVPELWTLALKALAALVVPAKAGTHSHRH